jgi:hypothetical protein
LRGGTAASAMAARGTGWERFGFGGSARQNLVCLLRPAPLAVMHTLAVSAPLVLSAGSDALKRSAARVAGSPAGTLPAHARLSSWQRARRSR